MKKGWQLLLANPGDAADTLLLQGASDGSPAELALEADGADGKKLPTFSMTAYNGGPMFPGGWYERDPIIIDLAGMETSQSVPIDAGHMEDIGHTTSIEKAVKAIKARGTLSAFSADPAEQDSSALAARRIVRMGSNGFPFQASIAPLVARSKIEFFRAGESVKVNGRSFDGPVHVARKSELKKIAILSLGADATTETKIAASLQVTNMNPELHAYILAAGYDPSKLTPGELAILQGMWQKSKATPPPAVTPPTPTAAEITAAANAAVAAERARVAAIDHAVEGLTLSATAQTQVRALHKRALANEIDLAGLNAGLIALVRADRAPPSVAAHSHEMSCTLDALQAALMLRSGLQLDNPLFAGDQAVEIGLPAWLVACINSEAKQKALEAAHKFADMSLLDIAREAVRLDGKHVPSGRHNLLKAAFSGGSLTNIFTTNVNTVVLSRYMSSPDTSAAWTRTTDVSDFKTNERPRLEKGGGLKKLPRGLKADHRKFGDKGESYKIARYAEQFSIDEQDMIDDSFSVLSDVPGEMADDAGRLRPDLTYAHLMSNPTLAATGLALFNTTTGTVNLHTTTALTAANLKTVSTAMNLLRENEVNIDTTPTHFIGPPTLDFLIKELVQSGTIVMTTTADVQRGSKNTLENLVTPVIEKRLENGLTDPDSETAISGSASTWYLASTRCNTIEVAYRRGTGRSPVVDSWQMREGAYGIGFSIALDIGVKAMDWRGLRKATA